MTDEDRIETQKQIESIRQSRESNKQYGYTSKELREMFGGVDDESDETDD